VVVYLLGAPALAAPATSLVCWRLGYLPIVLSSYAMRTHPNLPNGSSVLLRNEVAFPDRSPMPVNFSSLKTKSRRIRRTVRADGLVLSSSAAPFGLRVRAASSSFAACRRSFV